MRDRREPKPTQAEKDEAVDQILEYLTKDNPVSTNRFDPLPYAKRPKEER